MDRSGFIGGSDVSAIVGLSPWKTAYQLWEEKTGRSLPDDSENGEAKKWGKRLEPAVMEMIQEEWGIAIGARNVVHTMDGDEWARAEIDFEWIDDDGFTCNGDVKTSHWRKAHEWGEAWSDQVPAYYACQFLWGQKVTSRRKTLCGTLLGVGELRPYIIEWDEGVAEWLFGEARKFWHGNVLADTPPPVTTAEDAARSIKRFAGLTVTASAEVQQVLQRIRGIQAARKRLDALEASHKLTAQLQMATALPGDAAQPGKFGFVDESGKLIASWNAHPRKGYTVAPSTVRTFRLHN